MVRASAVLGDERARIAAGGAVALAFALYLAFAEELPRFSDWGDVGFLSLVALPLAFALVWLALPARVDVPPRILGAVAVGLAVIAAILHAADLELPANFAKLAAATALGWWFLTFFEAVWWVALVALLIVPIDLYSVAAGPTRTITEEQPQIYDALSVHFPVPGEELVAQLGLTDVLFFGLFLAASVRFGLRPGWTWLAMTASFGITLAIAVGLRQGGIAALPLLSLGFALVNADRIARSLRRAPDAEDAPRGDDDATRA